MNNFIITETQYIPIETYINNPRLFHNRRSNRNITNNYYNLNGNSRNINRTRNNNTNSNLNTNIPNSNLNTNIPNSNLNTNNDLHSDTNTLSSFYQNLNRINNNIQNINSNNQELSQTNTRIDNIRDNIQYLRNVLERYRNNNNLGHNNTQTENRDNNSLNQNNRGANTVSYDNQNIRQTNTNTNVQPNLDISNQDRIYGVNPLVNPSQNYINNSNDRLNINQQDNIYRNFRNTYYNYLYNRDNVILEPVEIEYEIPIYRSLPRRITLSELNDRTSLRIMDRDNTENNLTESVRSNDSRNDNQLCSICRCNIESGQIRRTINHCGHRFHQECIDLWLSNHNTCPMCRHDLTSPLENDDTELTQEDLQGNESEQTQEFHYHRYNPANYQDNTVLTEQELEDTNTHRENRNQETLIQDSRNNINARIIRHNNRTTPSHGYESV